MKKQISVALLGLALLFTAAATASAQATAAMRIHVPFDFVAGKKLMHAGDYSVRRVSDAAASGLIIQREGGDAVVVITNANGDTPSRAALTFRRYGEHYFLAEVSIPGTASVRRLPKDGAEKKAERESIEEAAAGGDEVRTVTVAGSLR